MKTGVKRITLRARGWWRFASGEGRCTTQLTVSGEAAISICAWIMVDEIGVDEWDHWCRLRVDQENCAGAKALIGEDS